MGAEEFLASGVLVLRMTRDDSRFTRTLTVKKMRGTPAEPGESSFVIVHEKGIVLDGDKQETMADQDTADQTLEFFELPKK
jgi:KaiC/GvpD/RAD55 family RecA-like ATPase